MSFLFCLYFLNELTVYYPTFTCLLTVRNICRLIGAHDSVCVHFAFFFHLSPSRIEYKHNGMLFVISNTTLYLSDNTNFIDQIISAAQTKTVFFYEMNHFLIYFSVKSDDFNGVSLEFFWCNLINMNDKGDLTFTFVNNIRCQSFFLVEISFIEIFMRTKKKKSIKLTKYIANAVMLFEFFPTHCNNLPHNFSIQNAR